MRTQRRKMVSVAVGFLVTSLAVAACGNTEGPSRDSAHDEVTVENCGENIAFPSPAEDIFVNTPNKLAMLLAIGASEHVTAVSGVDRAAQDLLARTYGADVVDPLQVVNRDYPTFENVIANEPDVFFAGWNSGYDEEQNLVPENMSRYGITAYTASYSCRQDDSESRGVMPPWDALMTDLTNLGEITGREDAAESVVADFDQRLDTLESAPEPDEKPTVFLFDNGTDDVLTSGSFGAPQAIIEAAGAENATDDIDDTWTSVSWERIAAESPDFIALNDYGDQSISEKTEMLRHNPATRDLPAVRNERFLIFPISVWTSSPFNIDAAEHLRQSLEEVDLVPESSIDPELDLGAE